MVAHLTTAGITDLDSINANDLAYSKFISLYSQGGSGNYLTFSNTSYLEVVSMDERNNSNNIWDTHAVFPPPPGGFSEQIWAHVTGGSQSSGNCGSFAQYWDRATQEVYATDVHYAIGWYGGDSFAMKGVQLTTTSSGYAPRDRGLRISIKHTGGGSSVLSSFTLEQRIFYT